MFSNMRVAIKVAVGSIIIFSKVVLGLLLSSEKGISIKPIKLNNLLLLS